MLHGVDIQPPSSPLFEKHRPSACAGARAAHQRRRTAFRPAPPHQGGRASAAWRAIIAAGWACTFHGSAISAAGGMRSDFTRRDDTGFLLARLEQLWPRVPRYKPMSVGVVLLGLVPASQHQPDLFAADSQGHQTTFPAGRPHQPALRALHHRLWPVPVRGAGVQRPRGFPAGAGEVGVLTDNRRRKLPSGQGAPKRPS